MLDSGQSAPSCDVGVDDFRRVMRRYPTGVVVVAAYHDGQPYGMTVNSFASVSLDPLLVMFCADRRSQTWRVIRSAGSFAVSVLGEDQTDIGRTFAGRVADRFASVAWSLTRSREPILDNAVAWLDCRIAEVLPAGDHDIALGHVREVRDLSREDPLVYHAGQFMTVGKPAA